MANPGITLEGGDIDGNIYGTVQWIGRTSQSIQPTKCRGSDGVGGEKYNLLL